MIRNYLITALRNLRRNLTHTMINMLGLTLGLGFSLVLFLIVQHFNGFDNWHPDKDKIYRAVTSVMRQDKLEYSSGLPAVMPRHFRSDFPEVKETLFISATQGNLVTIPTPDGQVKSFEERDGAAYTEPSYFDFFQRHWLEGVHEDWKDEPNLVVVSKRHAGKYFPGESAVGQTIQWNQQTELKIVGVMEDYTDQTDFPFDILISYATVREQKEEPAWSSIYSDDTFFVKLDKEEVGRMEEKMVGFVERHQREAFVPDPTYHFQPLRDIRFDTRFGNYRYNTIPKTMLTTLSLVAVFLILIAIINFINLSTAIAVKRSREVGVRKVMGGTRGQLAAQFMSETILIILLSMVAALGLAELLLLLFNPYSGLPLRINLFQNTQLLLGLGLTWAVVSLLAGGYPALLMSSFNPVRALKNQLNGAQSGKLSLRRGLVVFQFVITHVFVLGVIVIMAQTRYFYHKDLGFEKEAVASVNIPLPRDLERKRSLKAELAALPGVERVALGFSNPSSGSVSISTVQVQGSDEYYLAHLKPGDADYIDTYGLRLVAGEGLLESDTLNRLIVNEKFARTAGYQNPQDILGVMFNRGGRDVPVMGVVADFHTQSLRDEIEPVVLYTNIFMYYNVAVKIAPGRINETVPEIEKVWKRLYPDYEFQLVMMDQELDNFYQSEKRMLTIFLVFTGVAIFIGCLGLYGLVSYLAHRKVKEIGIRKVLGASVGHIILSFSREFVVLVLVGFALAAPIAWYLLNLWLTTFAYRIAWGGWIFATGLGFTLIVALFTVGYRSVRAALANPVEAIRNE